MNHDRWRIVKEKFQEVVAQPEAERASYLEKVCVGDAMLRAEIESLVNAYEELGGFLELPATVKHQAKKGRRPS